MGSGMGTPRKAVSYCCNSTIWQKVKNEVITYFSATMYKSIIIQNKEALVLSNWIYTVSPLKHHTDCISVLNVDPLSFSK